MASGFSRTFERTFSVLLSGPPKGGPHVLCVFALLILCGAAPARAQGADAAVRPFTIHVPDAVLADLKARLANARIPDPLQADGWTYGTDVRYLKSLVAYWRDTFDWRAQERRLNSLEQFTTTIDGVTIHFIHRRSKQPNAFPLIITHGWPGSFVEFTKIIGPSPIRSRTAAARKTPSTSSSRRSPASRSRASRSSRVSITFALRPSKRR